MRSCRGPRRRRSSSARSRSREGIEQPRILDVGVGSGAIALALKDERPDASVTGVDVSADALALARENAERLGLDVELRHADGAAAAGEGWDLVVANPPYVETPRRRAAGARRGSRKSRCSAPASTSGSRALPEPRFVVFEVGDGQAQEVAQLLERLGSSEVAITADLTGRDRVVEGRLP